MQMVSRRFFIVWGGTDARAPTVMWDAGSEAMMWMDGVLARNSWGSQDPQTGDGEEGETNRQTDNGWGRENSTDACMSGKSR